LASLAVTARFELPDCPATIRVAGGLDVVAAAIDAEAVEGQVLRSLDCLVLQHVDGEQRVVLRPRQSEEAPDVVPIPRREPLLGGRDARRVEEGNPVTILSSPDRIVR